MKGTKLIEFRGRKVLAEWPKRLKDAQRIKKFTLESGEKIPRVPYDGDHCHDCSAVKGELHVPGCDMERCGKCGGQWISCDCCCDED